MKNLKLSHQTIIDAIDQVLLSVRDYHRAKPKLRELEKILSAHFAAQNKAMFERLSGHHRSERESEKMIEFLIYDLKDVKVKFLIFYDRYPCGMQNINARNFSRDFQAFAKDIIERIKTEEDYLLPLMRGVEVGRKEDE